MLTVYGDHEQIFNSLKKGASGYLLKKTPQQKILDAIRDVQAGGRLCPTPSRGKSCNIFKKPASNQTENLTKREHELLAASRKASNTRKSPTCCHQPGNRAGACAHIYERFMSVRARERWCLSGQGRRGAKPGGPDGTRRGEAAWAAQIVRQVMRT